MNEPLLALQTRHQLPLRVILSAANTGIISVEVQLDQLLIGPCDETEGEPTHRTSILLFGPPEDAIIAELVVAGFELGIILFWDGVEAYHAHLLSHFLLEPHEFRFGLGGLNKEGFLVLFLREGWMEG